MRKFLLVLTLISLASCSIWQQQQNLGYLSYSQRAPAASVDLSRLETLLAVDKFDYYIGEYVNSFGKHIDEESVVILKSIDAKTILQKYANDQRILDAQKYDDLIYDIIKEGRPKLPLAKAKYKWGYNFFKNKLNGGFILMDTKLKTEDQSNVTSVKPDTEKTIPDVPFNQEELTLEADHYISNRTTRAVFWEAVESGRDVDFHLENSREFLKNLSQNGAKVIKEVRPFANNYNKIYVVQYPGESTYRYAITSIGGEDRFKHLVLQFGLSNLNNQEITNKMRVFGDIEQTHKYMEDELTGIMKHMPKADRVIIGQKGAIERTLDVMWKIRALKNLYDDDPDTVLNKVKETRRAEVKELFATQDYKKYDIFKNKKELETAFKELEDILEAGNHIPRDFKRYDYDNYVISMSDFVFKNKDNKTVVWRVAANSWGDEIAPLAKALKNSGHRHVTYIGTAGAYPDKGYKVGDLVIPTKARYQGTKTSMQGIALEVEGAKVGGTVDHVFSPFIETEEWLEESKQHAEFVEVETGYLRKVLNSEDFDFRAYLLISDILKSEGETLASASSAKRRNALNKLLYAMMDRDKMGIPKDGGIPEGPAVRDIVQKSIPKSGKAFQYYVMSKLEDFDSLNSTSVKNFVADGNAFSDNYFSQKLVEVSETTSFILRKIEEQYTLPKVSISSNLVHGTWNPKDDKLVVQFHVDTDTEEAQLKAIVEEFESNLSKIKKFAAINIVRGPPGDDFVTIPKFTTRDSDYLVQLFSQSAFKQYGLDAQVTYNGNLKYNFLPTTEKTEVCDAGKFCHLAYFAPDEATKDLMSNIDTHEKLLAVSGVNAHEQFNEAVSELSLQLETNGRAEDYKATIEVSKNASLENGQMAEIRPSFVEGKGLVIKVNFTPEGWKNPLVVLEELIHLNQIVSRHSYYKSPIFWAEIALNAEYGSMRSRRFNAEAEVHAMDELENVFLNAYGANEDVKNYIEARRQHAKKIVSQFKKEERVENKFRKGITKKWKTLQTELEKNDLKLDDYIADNNRTKVAELIDAYMPWENMEPTEIAAWTRWIDSIANPSTNEADKMITFRGLGNDLVKESNDGGHYLMAKLLTKNQGNYTRRLRSLKTYFKKKLGPKAGSAMKLDVQSLAAAFKGHSNEPAGSPYLSTSVLDVASQFSTGSGSKRFAAIRMDKSRNLINLVSGYGELEQMVPLIIFPDEMLLYSEVSSKEELIAEIEEKLGRPLTAEELSRNGTPDLEYDATKEWWNTINPEGITSQNATKTCKDVVKFFLLNR